MRIRRFATLWLISSLTFVVFALLGLSYAFTHKRLILMVMNDRVGDVLFAIVILSTLSAIVGALAMAAGWRFGNRSGWIFGMFGCVLTMLGLFLWTHAISVY